MGEATGGNMHLLNTTYVYFAESSKRQKVNERRWGRCRLTAENKKQGNEEKEKKRASRHYCVDTIYSNYAVCQCEICERELAVFLLTLAVRYTQGYFAHVGTPSAFRDTFGRRRELTRGREWSIASFLVASGYPRSKPQ